MLQAAYARVMIFGLMGLFHRLVTKANRTVRYLSDASCWLCRTHLPRVLGALMLLRDWPLPVFVKFTVVGGDVTAVRLVADQTVVRHRWLGRLLNGRKGLAGF